MTAGSWRVKCLLDSCALHCFLSGALAAQLPSSRRRLQRRGGRRTLRLAGGRLDATDWLCSGCSAPPRGSRRPPLSNSTWTATPTSSSATIGYGRMTVPFCMTPTKSVSAQSAVVPRVAASVSSSRSTVRPRRLRAAHSPRPRHSSVP